MNITERILHLRPDAKFVCWENDYNRIVWSPVNASQKPTLEELQAIPQSELDAAQATSQATASFDNQKAIKAVVIWVAQKLNVSPATARQEIINIYKSL